MIREIRIKNFKSVQKLKLELGRVNVFIGPNGCGKSNILEAITFGAAAAGNKLDNEFLATRGIRVTDPSTMTSAFEANEERIELEFIDESTVPISIWHSGGDYPRWQKNTTYYASLSHDPLSSQEQETYFDENIEEILNHLKDFLIYAPENLALRNFQAEAQIQPLGIHGEGLFRLLSILSKEEHQSKMEEIKRHLKLFDWFQDFELPESTNGSRSIRLQDRFIATKAFNIDQRSANEGFLYLLFYLTLLISPHTPPFFAIDNIDNALNPKLCAELTEVLAKLAKDHNKQVLLTTHNPAILDGLDLNDDEQRLFVVRRNLDGHTKVRRVEKKNSPDATSVKLSEAFMRGYLGGLNNF